MTSSIFITKNLNLLYLSIQALDPYATDKISQYSPRLDLINVFKDKENHLLRYTHSKSRYNVETTILIAYKLFKIASSVKLQKQIKLILQDVNQETSQYHNYSSVTQNYITRFQAEYSRSIDPYLVGQENYLNPFWIKKLSFLNLFLLNQLSKPYGTYIILIYISKNTVN